MINFFKVSVMDFDTIGRNELIGRLMLGGLYIYTMFIKKHLMNLNKKEPDTNFSSFLDGVFLMPLFKYNTLYLSYLPEIIFFSNYSRVRREAFNSPLYSLSYMCLKRSEEVALYILLL